MKKDVRVYLREVIERIDRIQNYSVDGYDTFLQSTLIQDAVLRNFEIIGEATKRIPKDFRLLHSEIPWQRMTGFRDVLIHDYDDINLDRVWETVQHDIPPLGPQIRAILLQLEENSTQ